MTGTIWEEDRERLGHKGSSVILESEGLPEQLCHLSLRFLNSIKALNSLHRQQIETIMQNRYIADYPSIKFEA